jgi:hypothetical protein
LTSVGTFNASGSTLQLECAGSSNYLACYGTTGTITPGSVTYGNVTIHGYATTWSLANQTMYVGGNLLYGDINSGSKSISSGTIFAYGDVAAEYNGNRGNTTIWLKGNPLVGQTFSGIFAVENPPIGIDAGTNTVTINGTMRTTQFTMTSVGTFNVGGSTIALECNGSGQTVCYGTTTVVNFGTQTYNDISIKGYATTWNLGASNPKVNGTFTFGDYNSTGAQITNGTIDAYGDITQANNGNRGTAVISVKSNATTGSTITGTSGKEFPVLEIAAGTNTVTLNGYIQLIKYTMVSVGTFNVAGSTLHLTCYSSALFCYGTTSTVNLGNNTYNNVTIRGYGTQFDFSGASPTINGDFIFGDINNGGKAYNNGTFNLYGQNITALNFGGRGNAVFNIKGNAGGQTLTGTSAMLYPITNIDSGTNPVTLSGTIRTVGWKMTSVGTFTTTGSTLDITCGSTGYSECYNLTSTLNVLGTVTYNNLYIRGNRTVWSLDGGAVTVNGDLVIGDTNILRAINNKTFNVKGSIASTNFGHNGTAIINLIGTASRTISGTGAWPATAMNINIAPGTLTFANTVALTTASQNVTLQSGDIDMAGFNYTVLGTLTINSGATLTKNLGVLTAGTLVNNGTINP